MPGAKDIRAGAAYVELLTKDAGLRKGLDNASKTLKKWGEGIGALGQTFMKIGAAVIAPLTATAKVFAEMGDQLAKASTRTGVGVEELSKLKYAAEQSGASFEDLETGLKKMQKTVVEAAKGSAQARDALGRLGLTVENLKGLKPEEQFELIAEQFSKIEDPAVAAATAMEIFGKGGASLIPMMKGGSAGIRQLAGDAERLGLVWSTQDAKAAEEFGDRLDDLWKVVKKATADIGGALAPVLREVAVFLTENAVAAGKWIREHRELIQTALKVGAGLVAAGAGLTALGMGIRLVGGVVGGVSTAIGAMSGVVGSAGKILAVVFSSGIGIAIAALAGLGAYLLLTTETGRAALSELGAYFAGLKDTAGTAIAGVTDAIKSGDWALALEVAMKGLKAVWLQGILPLREAWYAFQDFFVKVGADAFDGLMAAWQIARNALTTTWLKVSNFLGETWNNAITGMFDIWEKFENALEKGWLKILNLIGQLSDEEYEAAVKMADAQSRLTVANNNKERDEKNAAAQRKLGAGLGAEDARFNGAMAGIGQRNLDTRAAQSRAYQEQVDAAKAQADAAKKQMEEAAARAKQRRNDKENAPKPVDNLFGLPVTAAGWQKIAMGLAAGPVQQTLDDVATKTTSVQGTFNSAALFALGGGDVSHQQLDVAKKQLDRQKKMAEALKMLAERRGGTFS